MKRLMIFLSLAGLTGCTGSTSPHRSDKGGGQLVVSATPQASSSDDDDSYIDGVSSATAVPSEVSFNGTMVMPPQAHASVSLSLDGIIRSTALLPGAYVRKGDVLATVENPEFIELQETYLDAVAQLEFLEAEYNRQRVLAQEEAASRKRLEQSKADYLSMKSRRDGASARLTMLGIPTESLVEEGIIPLLEVRAPISGYLSNMHMNMGKHVTAGEPLCEIIDKSNMLVKLTAYEKDLPGLKTGDAVEFRVNGLDDDVFSGKIISVGHSVDDASRSIEVYASVDNKNTIFRPGMYVNARIIAK